MKMMKYWQKRWNTLILETFKVDSNGGEKVSLNGLDLQFYYVKY